MPSARADTGSVHGIRSAQTSKGSGMPTKRCVFRNNDTPEPPSLPQEMESGFNISQWSRTPLPSTMGAEVFRSEA